MKKSILALSLSLLLQLTLFSSFSFAQNWAWAKSAGGLQKVESYSIAIDNAGNSYITGWFEDSLKFGSFTLKASVAGNSFASDIFIAKYDINGNFVWAKKAGGTSYDYGTGITTDANGNVYVTGLFLGTAAFGTLSISSISADYDVFIAKYAPDGTALWVRKGGGTAWDVGSGICIDKSGNCFIAGAFRGTATFGTTSLISAGNYDGFVAKYDSAGVFKWAKSAGGLLEDRAQSISTDAIGNCYVIGFYNGSATVGTTPLTSVDSSDVWIAKYDPTGAFVWAKSAGGAGADEGKGIVSDDLGNTHVTGFFEGSALFSSINLTSAGSRDIFVGKYDYKGDIIWMKGMGGAQGDVGYGISIDSSGNTYVAGSFYGAALFDTINVVSSNQDDAFVAALDYVGSTKWLMQGGGGDPDIGRGVIVSTLGSCYTTGYYSGSATFGTHSISGFSDNDLFVAKLDSVFIVNPPIITGSNDDATNLKNFVVYPNPSNTDVTIQFETKLTSAQVSIELFDILGKIVTDRAIVSESKSFYNKKQVTINRGSLPDGLYFGKVIAGNKIYTARFMLISPGTQR
ncbi:MAG: SBBP repeat-containing protein [Bacteroidota bacterium]